MILLRFLPKVLNLKNLKTTIKQLLKLTTFLYQKHYKFIKDVRNLRLPESHDPAEEGRNIKIPDQRFEKARVPRL